MHDLLTPIIWVGWSMSWSNKSELNIALIALPSVVVLSSDQKRECVSPKYINYLTSSTTVV